MNTFYDFGSTVLFYGDSITDANRVRDLPRHLGNGYPRKVATIYNTLFSKNDIKFYNRGISGNNSSDLVARYNTDVKKLRPDFISILIGINDTWQGLNGNTITVETFEENVCTLLKSIKHDLPNTKIMLMEPYLLNSDPEKIDWHADLDPKINVIKKLGSAFADYYICLSDIFAEDMAKGTAVTSISADGVHPLDYGHGLIAEAYLKALNIL